MGELLSDVTSPLHCHHNKSSIFPQSSMFCGNGFATSLSDLVHIEMKPLRPYDGNEYDLEVILTVIV